MTLLNYDILAVVVYERIGLLVCVRICVCHLDLVVAESEVLYAEKIEDMQDSSLQSKSRKGFFSYLALQS